MVKVKICGITNPRDAAAALEAGADALGFVFARSPRRITPGRAEKIIEKVGPFVAKVGVFVNEKEGLVRRIIRQCRLSAVQFHGDETPAYCSKFKGDVFVIKAFRMKDEAAVDRMREYGVDAFLLDAYEPNLRGGTGKTFDWALAKKAKNLGVPIILSGGLNPGNVRQAIKKVSPYAVDASSGVEAKPGRKNHRLVREFIRRAKGGR